MQCFRILKIFQEQKKNPKIITTKEDDDYSLIGSWHLFFGKIQEINIAKFDAFLYLYHDGNSQVEKAILIIFKNYNPF